MALPTSVDYTGPARHLGKMGYTMMGQHSPAKKPTVQGGMGASPKTGTGKNTMGVQHVESYSGPGFMAPKDHGEVSNEPMKSASK